MAMMVTLTIAMMVMMMMMMVVVVVVVKMMVVVMVVVMMMVVVVMMMVVVMIMMSVVVMSGWSIVQGVSGVVVSASSVLTHTRLEVGVQPEASATRADETSRGVDAAVVTGMPPARTFIDVWGEINKMPNSCKWCCRWYEGLFPVRHFELGNRCCLFLRYDPVSQFNSVAMTTRTTIMVIITMMTIMAILCCWRWQCWRHRESFRAMKFRSSRSVKQQHHSHTKIQKRIFKPQ